MKKILSLILALIMMLSCASMIFADDTVITDEAPVEVDETASAYYEAVQFLVAYDIMHGKGETLGVYDDIQRYEAALFFGRILSGWTDDSTWEDGTLNSSEFTDLAGTAAENYYGAISYVNQKGVIEGYGNGKFGPTDGIIYQDALTMAVRALGYNNLTYPWGYIETAINLGITEGISGVVYTETLKREVVAQIIYNTLFAENKAGETLAETVFDLNLAWTNIIITDTDLTSGEVPAGYVGFCVLNDDGTIGADTYYVEAAQLGLTGDHDDEKAWGTVYKVMFDTEAEFGLNKVISYESLELDTIVNSGRLEMTTAGYPIQAFLADYDIVTRFSTKTYLNTTPEILLADGNGIITAAQAMNYYAVDWKTGNILYIDEQQYDEMWACGYHDDEWQWFMFKPDYSQPKNRYGLMDYVAAQGWDTSLEWHILSTEDYETLDPWKCNKCGFYTYSYDQHNDLSGCGWQDAVSYGVIAHTYSEVLWYYNEKIDAYFQLQYKEVVDGVEIVGVKYMTAAQRAELEVLLNTYNNYVYDRIAFIEEIETDASALNGYASLRVFDFVGDELADYGIYEEYYFGVIANTAAAWCPYCNDGDGARVAGYTITNVSETPLPGNPTTTQVYTSEAGCNHGELWVSDGAEIVDGSYVIYGINQATGELKIVKTISGTMEEDEDNYIGHGYIRAYNVSNYQVTIGGEKLSYNYPQLKGSITPAMLTTHKNPITGKDGEGFPAIANRYLDSIFNQYVEYVVVDGRLVYIELEGASDNLIVIETYAGIHEDGAIVVWGYEVGTDVAKTELKQFRIASFNGWANGDWYNYSFYNEEEIIAAFQRGAVYQIKSYDDAVDGYNVQILTGIDVDYNYAQYGTWTEITYADAKVGGMSLAGKAAGVAVERIMKSTDKYVFIYDIENVDGYNAIPITTYEGIVTNTEAYAKGYRVGDTDGIYIMYIDDKADIKGFPGAAEQGYGLVMFLEWGSSAAYDEAAGKDYLVGATVRQAYVLDIFTGRTKEITVYPGNYVKAEIDGERGTLGDGYGDNLSAGYIYFSEIKGYVYQTVNGVLVNDEIVAPEDIPAIIAEAVKGTDIIADEVVLETGKFVARFDGETNANALSVGWDGAYEGDMQGFATSEINRRMTYKSLGVAYKELSPYALALENKAAVIVCALKAEGEMLAIKSVGQSAGARTDYKYFLCKEANANYGVKNADLESAMNWIDSGDARNDTQAYNYSLIYYSDHYSTSTRNKDSVSNAVVYLYDFNDDASDDITTPYANLVDGLDTYKVVNGVASGNASKLGVDNVVVYAPFDVDGDVAGKTGKGLNSTTWAIVDEALPAFEDGVFSIAFWYNPRSWSGDPVIMGTQDWDSGSNPGFGFYQDGTTLYLNMADGDNRVKFQTKSNDDSVFHEKWLYRDYTTGHARWLHIAITVDVPNNSVKLYINGAAKAWESAGDFSGFDASKLVGEDHFTLFNDGDLCYTPNCASMDNLVITDDVLTAAEVKAIMNK